MQLTETPTIKSFPAHLSTDGFVTVFQTDDKHKAFITVLIGFGNGLSGTHEMCIDVGTTSEVIGNLIWRAAKLKELGHNTCKQKVTKLTNCLEF